MRLKPTKIKGILFWQTWAITRKKTPIRKNKQILQTRRKSQYDGETLSNNKADKSY